MTLSVEREGDVVLVEIVGRDDVHTFNMVLEGFRMFAHPNGPADRLAGRILDVTVPLSGDRRRVDA